MTYLILSDLGNDDNYELTLCVWLIFLLYCNHDIYKQLHISSGKRPTY